MKLPDRRLLEYLEDEVTGSERAEIEKRLTDSPPAQRRLSELERMIAGLRAEEEGLASVNLVAGVRAAIERQLPAPRRRLWVPAAGAAAVAAAAVVLLVTTMGGDRSGETDEFRAKAAGAAAAADGEVAIEAYAVAAGEPVRLVRALPHGAGLLFAYRNRSARRHLMIFAVDGRGAVYWFYPAHQIEGGDPRSIDIAATGSAAVELPDQVDHDLAPGPLAIVGLFTAGPQSVSEIEAVVADLVQSGAWDARRPPRLPIAGSAQHIIAAEVTAP